MESLEKVFLKYRHRADFTVCPRCHGKLKWLYDGSEWIPCDLAPVLVYPYQGHTKAMYKGELIDCTQYSGLQEGIAPVYAHQPHFFTCRRWRR